MAQIFDRRTNTAARLSIIVGVPTILVILLIVWWVFSRSDWHRDVGVPVEQPVEFSHALHVTANRIDCRFCHTSVEVSSSAGIPATETCMGCHTQILTGSTRLAPVRASWANNTPIEWVKVHDLPNFVYFNHSIHVAKGVGCSTCHGNVAQIRDGNVAVAKEHALYMTWCLDCHRAPENYLRPKSEIYNSTWAPPPDQRAQGLRLKEEYGIRTANELTNCAICHR